MDEPVIGEKVETPEGFGYVLEVTTFEDEDTSDKGRDWEYQLAAKVGKNYESDYYRVQVNLCESDKIELFDCWEIKFNADRDIEDAPWRA